MDALICFYVNGTSSRGLLRHERKSDDEPSRTLPNFSVQASASLSRCCTQYAFDAPQVSAAR